MPKDLILILVIIVVCFVIIAVGAYKEWRKERAYHRCIKEGWLKGQE